MVKTKTRAARSRAAKNSPLALGWRRLWSHDIGVDLGTANTLVYVRGRGIVIDEPSVVAINRKTHELIALGHAAKAMVGKTPGGIVAARPLIDGVVSDFEVTEQMLKNFVSRIHGDYGVIWPRPRMVVGLPSGVTEVERRAVEEAARNAGARSVHLIEEPIAAALGAGLPVREPRGSMIIDIGGGTTEIAVMALGGIVVCKSLRTAGDEQSEAIMQHLRDEFNLAIGESTAEKIKLTIGNVHHGKSALKLTVRGRNLMSGLPQAVTLAPEHVRQPLIKQVRPIVEAVHMTLEEAPPELVGDILNSGIVLTGGGSLLGGLSALIAQETRMPVKLAKNALTAVVEGTGQVLEDFSALSSVLLAESDY